MSNKTKKEKEFFGFHISLDDGKVRGKKLLESDPGNLFVPGTVHKATGRLKMCAAGMHASPTIMDAMKYRHLLSGRVVSLVKVWGDARSRGDKIVGRYRKVLASLKLDDVVLEERTVFSYNNGEPAKILYSIPAVRFVMDLESRLAKSYASNKRRVDATNIPVNFKK